MLLSVIFLAIKPRRVPEKAPDRPAVDVEPARWGEPDTGLTIRRDDTAVETPAGPAPTPVPAAQTPAGESAPARNIETLKAAAKLCTDIGRVADVEELRTLVGRAADLLNASGLILWLADDSSPDLRPAVAHGYPAETVLRIPALPRNAENAAAAAFRSSALQIVLSRPGSASKGAIVAPVLSTEGCIGVLAAEVRDGAEASETIQALAAIVAAQLGGVVAVAPAQADSRVKSGARM